MPSKSPAQAKMMRAVAHSPKFAKKVNIPQSVGEEFAEADKRKDSPMEEATEPKKYGGQFNLPKTAKPMKTSMRNC